MDTKEGTCHSTNVPEETAKAVGFRTFTGALNRRHLPDQDLEIAPYVSNSDKSIKDGCRPSNPVQRGFWEWLTRLRFNPSVWQFDVEHSPLAQKG